MFVKCDRQMFVKCSCEMYLKIGSLNFCEMLRLKVRKMPLNFVKCVC